MTSSALVAAEHESPLQEFARRFAENRIAVAALLLLLAIVGVALLAPVISPQNPYDASQLDLMDSKLAPRSSGATGNVYWLGTDDQGRDLLSAILYGLRISLFVGVVATLVAFVVGTLAGMLAAYRGGALDALIMRLVDLQLSFPSMLVALMILALLGKGIGNVVLALVIVEWAYIARTARGAAIAERSRDYVDAARCLSLPAWRVMLRHLLPNCLPSLMVVASMQVARAISLEATLSFLGIGVPVTEPSLGLLIANGYQHLLAGNYWISFFPGVALLTTIVAMNLVGDHLRTLLNPRLHT